MIEKRQTSLFSGVWREIRKKIIKISQKNAKFDEENEKNRKFNYSIAKKCWRFLTKKLRLENTQTDPTRTVQRSALCRSRRELSNEYSLAKIGVDTAENEPLEVWAKIQFTIHFTPYWHRARRAHPAGAAAAGGPAREGERRRRSARGSRADLRNG